MDVDDEYDDGNLRTDTRDPDAVLFLLELKRTLSLCMPAQHNTSLSRCLSTVSLAKSGSSLSLVRISSGRELNAWVVKWIINFYIRTPILT